MGKPIHEYRCSQKCSLDVHKKWVSVRAKDFVCTDCGHQTSNKTTLNKHMNAAHLRINKYSHNTRH